MKALGLDIGSVTVGIALSDSLKMFASAYSVIRYEEENDDLFKQIVDIIKKEDVDVVVVGMPYHMNGDFSLGCERTRRFEEKIKQLIDIEIVEIDETLMYRRKYNRGRLLNDVWIFGGICREDGRVFAVVVENRKEETLWDQILQHI